MNETLVTIPEIPRLDAKLFDGSTNEQFGYEGEVDYSSPALEERHAYMRKIATELDADINDPKTPEDECAVSACILQFLAEDEGEVKQRLESVVLHPIVYLVLETHIMSHRFKTSEIVALTDFITRTIDPEALGGTSEVMSDIDIFFAQTAGMEFTAGIFTVVQSVIDAVNRYRTCMTNSLMSATTTMQ